DVADQQAFLRIERDTVRLPQLRGRRGTAVAAEPRDARASDRGDHVRLGVDAPHDMILHLGDEQIATLIEADLVRLIHRGRERRASVARISLLAATGDSRNDMRFKIEPADPMIPDFAEVERAVRTDGKAVRIIDLRLDRRTAVSR